MKQKTTSNIKSLLILHAGILIYSLSTVFSKLAAGNDFFSFRFVLFYGISLLLLFCYAIVWQQALKKFDLNTAYANRAAALVWSVLFGFLIFRETITLRHILGVAVIIVGVIVVVTSDE